MIKYANLNLFFTCKSFVFLHHLTLLVCTSMSISFYLFSVNHSVILKKNMFGCIYLDLFKFYGLENLI